MVWDVPEPENTPAGRIGAQDGIGWTPADRELSACANRRDNTAQRILARLAQGPATSIELARITHRFSARIYDLRKRGHQITREDHKHDGAEWSTYTLARHDRGEGQL
jgi:hypothetical protein